MNRFVAYFDILGYKQFLDNCPPTDVEKWVDKIFLNVELSISGGKTTKAGGIAIADLSKSNISATVFSDTIVFWTPDDSISSFTELLGSAYEFNWRMILFDFPIRGYVNFGEIGVRKGNPTAKYGVNSIFGKEALRAYYMAESMEWAGTVIDENVVSKVNSESDFEKLISDKVIQYKVPFRISPTLIDYKKEFCLRIVANNGAFNQEAFENYENSIRENFTRFDKDCLERTSVKKKYAHTINFLRFLLIDPYQ